jgi:hypothetical protein
MLGESISMVSSARFVDKVKVEFCKFTYIMSNVAYDMLRGVVIVEIIMISVDFDQK